MQQTTAEEATSLTSEEFQAILCPKYGFEGPGWYLITLGGEDALLYRLVNESHSILTLNYGWEIASPCYSSREEIVTAHPERT